MEEINTVNVPEWNLKAWFISTATADNEPLETRANECLVCTGYILLLYLFDFIVEVVIWTKAKMNSHP